MNGGELCSRTTSPTAIVVVELAAALGSIPLGARQEQSQDTREVSKVLRRRSLFVVVRNLPIIWAELSVIHHLERVI